MKQRTQYCSNPDSPLLPVFSTKIFKVGLNHHLQHHGQHQWEPVIVRNGLGTLSLWFSSLDSAFLHPNHSTPPPPPATTTALHHLVIINVWRQYGWGSILFYRKNNEWGRGGAFGNRVLRKKSELEAALVHNNFSGLKCMCSQSFLHTNIPIDRVLPLSSGEMEHACHSWELCWPLQQPSPWQIKVKIEGRPLCYEIEPKQN